MDFKKLHRDAKKIKAKRPGMQYKTALKDAAKMQKGKRISGVRRKKKSATSHRTRSRIGAIETTGSAIAKARRAIEEKLAWTLLAKESAKRVSDRKKKAKEAAELKRKLKALS